MCLLFHSALTDPSLSGIIYWIDGVTMLCSQSTFCNVMPEIFCQILASEGLENEAVEGGFRRCARYCFLREEISLNEEATRTRGTEQATWEDYGL